MSSLDPLYIFGRTAAQLAAIPTAQDFDMAFTAFYVLNTDPSKLYRCAMDGQSYVLLGGGVVTTGWKDSNTWADASIWSDAA